MKKAIRILIPIILTIAILLCIAWYLFVYDREFTRDMLLGCARYCESQGYHTTAAVFYDLAYSHSGDNDAVAIELAEQYVASGNYTKAEYTLSNAIADGGGVDLYIALCKTYVAQDKLLDAVNMLENITDPGIKAQLDTMRPEVPTVDLKPGFYSQYMSVGLQTESGTLYVTSDGEYPSLENAPYTEPVALVEGENTIYALSVSNEGLVSPLGVFGYTIGGIIEEVLFTDPAFESEVRTLLNTESDDILFTNDLWDILEFTMPSNVESYADLKYLSFLEHLYIDNGNAEELHFISSLEHLTELAICNTSVSEDDLIMISELPLLDKLTLKNCNISSIEAITPATNLVALDLSNNTIRNLKALSAMPFLQELVLQHNAVTDLTALASIKTLERLDVSYNALTSIAPICELTKLTWLDVNTNSITDIGNLSQLTALTYLSLANNKISDISKAASCTALEELDISNNILTDITMLAPLSSLMYFNFSHNEITALPDWSDDCTLVTIDGSHNLLESIDTLSGLPSLNNVFMDYNPELTSIDSLASCPMLIQVNVYGTKVTEVEALTNQSIIVNYNPVQEEE